MCEEARSKEQGAGSRERLELLKTIYPQMSQITQMVLEEEYSE
ncbi:MAG: hypothetical protein ABSF90_14800 [Syntrophobacteraceae bacterium]|jgi:regulator of sigma D